MVSPLTPDQGNSPVSGKQTNPTGQKELKPLQKNSPTLGANPIAKATFSSPNATITFNLKETATLLPLKSPEVPTSSPVISSVTPAVTSIALPEIPEKEIQALERINFYRTKVGLPNMQVSLNLEKMAEAHAHYWLQNYGDPELQGMGLHEEIQGHPGFTAPSISDRGTFWHYPGYVNENIALIGEPAKAVDEFMATVNHRLPILDPRYTDIGFGEVSTGTTGIVVLDFGQIAEANGSTKPVPPVLLIWPPKDSPEIGRAYYGEAPNPFPQAQFPLGYPITVKWTGPGTLAVTKSSLQNGNKEDVATLAIIGNGYMSSNTIILVAQQPLEGLTTYQANIEGVADGLSFKLKWSFKTGEKN